MNTIILLIAAFISCLQSQSLKQEDNDAVCISQMSQEIISQIRTDINDIFNDCYDDNEFNQLITSTPAPIVISEDDNDNNFNAPTLAPIPEDIINAVIETINERGIDMNNTNETSDGNITNVNVVLGSNEEDDAICVSEMSQDILSSVRKDLDDILNDCYQENGFEIDQLAPTPTIGRLDSGNNDNFNAPTLAPIPEDIISAISEIINDRGIETNQTNETSDGDIGVLTTNGPNNNDDKRCAKTGSGCGDDNDCCGSLECGDRFVCIINRL